MSVERFTVTAADAPEWVEEKQPAIFCSHCGLETELVPVYTFGQEKPTREITKCCGAQMPSEPSTKETPYR